MAELEALQGILEEVRAVGAELVAISPQTEANNGTVIQKLSLGFGILRDEGNTVAAEYGLRFELPQDLQEVYSGFGVDLPDINGEPSWTLPMPARYVIDQEGKVSYARVHPDYTRRPEPDETFQALVGVVEAS